MVQEASDRTGINIVKTIWRVGRIIEVESKPWPLKDAPALIVESDET